MNYQNAKDITGAISTTTIKRISADGSVAIVPNDPANRDWVIYQAWLAAGNTPLAAE